MSQGCSQDSSTENAHKQDTALVLFSLYANMQQGKCKYFKYGFLRNEYLFLRKKYPKGISNIAVAENNIQKDITVRSK
jgi:hypothetical protein